MRKPIIGMPAIFSQKQGGYVPNAKVSQAVIDAGGQPLHMPTDQFRPLPDIDGLVIPGGKDVDPSLYGESPLEQTTGFSISDDEIEISMIRECVEKGLPILSICRGTQILNVAFGGNLWQDIASQTEATLSHTWNGYDKSLLDHNVLVSGEKLSHLLCKDSKSVAVNSRHHQAVRNPGKGLSVAAVSEDGIIEALEGSNIIAVQWHPEDLEAHQCLFKWLVEEAAKNQ